MEIIGIKAKVFMAGSGMMTEIAEAHVRKNDGEEVYVTLDCYEGEEYTVQKGSMYEFFAEDSADPECNFDECWTSWKDAKASAYAAVFEKLKKVMGMLG